MLDPILKLLTTHSDDNTFWCFWPTILMLLTTHFDVFDPPCWWFWPHMLMLLTTHFDAFDFILMLLTTHFDAFDQSFWCFWPLILMLLTHHFDVFNHTFWCFWPTFSWFWPMTCLPACVCELTTQNHVRFGLTRDDCLHGFWISSVGDLPKSSARLKVYLPHSFSHLCLSRSLSISLSLSLYLSLSLSAHLKES